MTLSQVERDKALGQSLRSHAPGDWDHDRAEVVPGPYRREIESWYTRADVPPGGSLRLEVVLRSDGDVDVRFHAEGYKPDVLEAHFVLSEGSEPEALDELGRFVGDFVMERLVLGYNDSFFGGGRVFLPAADAESRKARKLAWLASWRGTYDWKSR